MVNDDEAQTSFEDTAADLLSTSAQLRQTQRDLAASQADLSRVEGERDDWKATADQIAADIAEADRRRDLARTELASARTELEKLRAENDLLMEARRWQVARQDAGPCLMCGLPMVRSQAVKPVPGTTKGTWMHVECPDVKAFPWVVARDGGRDCDACGHEIRRGEAYEYRGGDELAHIHCPTPTQGATS